MSAATVLRKYGRLTVILLVCLAGSFTLYQLGNRFFAIKNIEVAGQGVNVLIDQNRIPKNLLFFPADKLREQILRDNPVVEQVTFKKKLPHTLVIIATPRLALARLNSPSGLVVLDRTGIILNQPQVSGEVLPLLLFPLASARIGERVTDRQILVSLAFIEKTRSFLTISTIEATDSASLLAKTTKINIFIAQEADVSSPAATLQTLLMGFRIKGNLPTKIDLRFDKPIVTF